MLWIRSGTSRATISCPSYAPEMSAMTDRRFVGLRSVMSGQNPANNILIYICCESQVDLIGDLRTSPTGISPFHIDDRADEFLRRALRTGFGAPLWRKQEPILSFNKGVMKA
jgi:hypothetical protein